MSLVSFRNFNWVVTGTTNSFTSLIVTNPRTNALYYIGILNNGTGDLTINTGLGLNIRTVYSSAIVIPTGRYAMMIINVLSINSVQQFIVDVNLLTN